MVWPFFNGFSGIQIWVLKLFYCQLVTQPAIKKIIFVKILYNEKIAVLAVVLVQSVFVMAQDETKGLNVNDQAPEFSATDQNGKSFDLKMN